jgi:DNA-directed RNA polymerase
MEYSRYVAFLNNENIFEFYTYLPIQLDATCNGFQHLVLLSNEDTLFKELNLITDNDAPKDFYNFLVQKLYGYFDKNIEENIVDTKGGSYERLKNFALDRSCLKKAIMTIPYNATQLSMRKYITDSLHLAENTKEKDNLI